MVISTKKKASSSEDLEALIAVSLEQSDTLSASLKSELREISFSQATINALQSEIGQRDHEREMLQRNLQGLHQTVKDARAQTMATTGPAAQASMTTLLAAEQDAQKAQAEFDALQIQHAATDLNAHATISDHQQSIVEREAHVHELERKLREVSEARQRHLAELGESLHKEATQRLQRLTTKAQSIEDQMLQIRRDLAAARSEEDGKLARWPAFRQDLARTYAIGEDATSTALALFAHFLDTIISDHQAIENAQAGLPAGTYSILSEFAIDPYHLRALASSGDATILTTQKERIESLLHAYRNNLAVAQKA